MRLLKSAPEGCELGVGLLSLVRIDRVYSRVARLGRRADVLVRGCSNGRVTLRLAEMGLNVTVLTYFAALGFTPAAAYGGADILPVIVRKVTTIRKLSTSGFSGLPRMLVGGVMPAPSSSVGVKSSSNTTSSIMRD